MSLIDNGVHDGELLVLTVSRAPAVGLTRADPSHAVASAGDPAPESAGRFHESGCAWAALLGSVALAWTGGVPPSPSHLVVAGCGAVVVCVAAALRGSGLLAVAGSALSAAAGFLAVPSAPGAPNVFLSATAALAVAIVMTRLVASSYPALIATATCAALVAAASGAAVVTAVPVATVGAVVATGALGVLAVAPRLSILMSGLGARPEPDPSVDLTARATRGHATLTGLVVGTAISASVGTTLIAFEGLRGPVAQMAGVAFAFVTGLVLLLRARTHVDSSRRVALVISGLLSATAAFAVVVAAAPDRASWVAACVLAVGLGTLRRSTLTPVATRAVDLLDYAAVAAIVPLACWVGGLYQLTRNWPLT